MGVGGLQRPDIVAAGLGGFHQVRPAPAEPLPPKLSDQQVGGQPRVTSVAVRERMDRDEAVVEAHRNLIRREGLVVNPVADVANQGVEIHSDLVRRDADVELGGPLGAGPSPDRRKSG